MFSDFWIFLEISGVFRESPQNLHIDFKHTGPNPAILRNSPQNLREKRAKKTQKVGSRNFLPGIGIMQSRTAVAERIGRLGKP